MRGQQQRKQQLTLDRQMVVHDDLKEYGHSYSISTQLNITVDQANENIRIHSHNVNNVPIYPTQLRKSNHQ